MPSFTPLLTSKLPEVSTSIFTVMSALANQHNAINLSQGFPNFPSDPVLSELVNKAMLNNFNQYAPMAGIMDLRAEISRKVNDLYGVVYNPESEVTVTAGATQALFTAMAASIEKGDEVIIFKPAYDSYEPTIQLLGGIPVSVQVDPEKFNIDWQMVKGLINSKTKMIIINSPHNPSGNVMSVKDMQQLELLLKDTNILLLSDEVYEHILFDNEVHQSAGRYPGLAERTFICASFGKTFHTTGWKVGYCLAPKELTKEFRKVHQFNVFSVNHPVQVALAEYLKRPENYLNVSSFYEGKRNLFLSLIKESRFTWTPCKGTYFQLLNYSAISDENDYDLALRLTKENKIASIPVSVFNVENYNTKVLRFCFAKTDETLKRAAEILCSI
jgi:methionine aminotransferase